MRVLSDQRIREHAQRRNLGVSRRLLTKLGAGICAVPCGVPPPRCWSPGDHSTTCVRASRVANESDSCGPGGYPLVGPTTCIRALRVAYESDSCGPGGYPLVGIQLTCIQTRRRSEEHYKTRRQHNDDNITTARGTSDVANRWASVDSAGRVLPTVIDYNDDWTVTRLMTFLIYVCIRSAGNTVNSILIT